MIKDIDGLLEKVKYEIREFIDIAIIGLSGGADSSLAALLCVEALGKDNVVGLHIPYNQLDKDTFNSRSEKLADRLGIDNFTVDISGPTNAMIKECAGNTKLHKLSMLNQGNMRSRMRMIALYTTCCQIGEQTGKRCRVVGTGNISEDIIGYDTLGGDQLADLFIIGTLLKSEVYQLLDYFIAAGIITEEFVDRVPSAGLWDGQTDADELGYTYDQMEPSVLRLLSGNIDQSNSIDKFVLGRHLTHKHKHEARPVVDLSMFRDD